MSSSLTDRDAAPGSIEVAMPQMGVSVAEGTIVEWRKRPGDWVESDEVVCVVTTDKVDVEIPSPASGRLERILVEAGRHRRGGDAARRDRRRAPARARPIARRSTDSHGGAPSGRPGRRAGPLQVLFARRPEDRRRARHRPRASRPAPGSAAGCGRRDLLAAIAEGDERRPARGPAAAHRVSLQARAGARRGPGADRRLRREPMTPMRRLIADHMIESRRTSAHCTTIVEVDLAGVVAARAARREEMAARGVSLTYLAFVAEATVAALQRHPDPERVGRGGGDRLPRRRQPRDRCRARDGPDRSGDPARAAAQPRGAGRRDRGSGRPRARPGSCSPTTWRAARSRSPTRGSSGPCSRPRSSTSRRWRSSTSRPSSSGRSSSRDAGGDSIAIRPMTNLCMSWDHRALDGAEAARFLGEVKASLEGVESRMMAGLEHEELHVRRGERTGIYVIVAIHSTALGPALGGARLWRYETRWDGVTDALRLSARDDAQGGRRRARPRRRQVRDLRRRTTRARAASPADGSTSARRSSRSTAAT